jgi:hypothetical protein
LVHSIGFHKQLATAGIRRPSFNSSIPGLRVKQSTKSSVERRPAHTKQPAEHEYKNQKVRTWKRKRPDQRFKMISNLDQQIAMIRRYRDSKRIPGPVANQIRPYW